MKEEKIFRRKYSVDTLTDIATVNFGCASSLSQSKKDNIIEVVELIDRKNIVTIWQLCNPIFYCLKIISR